jgi:hypothetical protein
MVRRERIVRFFISNYLYKYNPFLPKPFGESRFLGKLHPLKNWTMTGNKIKMKLIIWIPCLLAGILVFFILNGVSEGVTGLAGRIGTAAQAVAAAVSGVAVLGLYYLWNKLWDHLRDRPWPNDLPLRRCLPDTGRGILTGIMYFIIVVGVIALAGCYRITAVRFEPLALLRALAMFFVVAVCEEVLFRGIIFRMIDLQFNSVAAYIISALIFGAAHLGNPGATWWAAIAIAIEAGILLSAAYKYSGTLWMPIGIHWAWNFTQGDILGFRVSGGNAGESLFIPEISGPDLITGGAFGAEASVVAVVIGALFSVLLILASLRRPR